jgi:hypothetical protein
MKTLLAALAAFFAAAAHAQEAAFHYDGTMRIDPATGDLTASWRIEVRESELDQIVFLLSTSYEEVGMSGEAIADVEVAAMEGFAGQINAFTLTLHPADPGETREIRFRYDGRPMDPPPQHGINSIGPRKAEFTVDSFWMPFDQRFSSLITAELEIGLTGVEAERWTGVSTERVERREGGFLIRQQRPSLDLAFTLMADPVVSGSGDYRIYDARETPGEGVEAVEEALEFCTGYLNALAGPAGPLPNAAITVNDRSAGGYSRGTLIALTDISDTEPAPLTQFICHELAHYWSRGNAMTVENWLNESFADYTAIMAEREAFGEQAFQDRMERYAAQVAAHEGELPPIWTPETTARGPYLNQYRRGPLALAELEGMMGREGFAVLMRRFMTDEIATTPDLLALVEELAGADVREAFAADVAD